MSALADYWDTWVAAAVADPTLVRGAAVDLMQIEISVSNGEGNAWFDAVADYLHDRGAIAGASSYVGLRDEMVADGAVAAGLLFRSIEKEVVDFPESSIVAVEFDRKGFQDAADQAGADIVTVTDHRDLQSDEAIIAALDEGIAKLQKRQTNQQIRADEL